jgi:hypothetical protein
MVVMMVPLIQWWWNMTMCKIHGDLCVYVFMKMALIQKCLLEAICFVCKCVMLWIGLELKVPPNEEKGPRQESSLTEWCKGTWICGFVMLSLCLIAGYKSPCVLSMQWYWFLLSISKRSLFLNYSIRGWVIRELEESFYSPNTMRFTDALS